jgi:sugar lactone lactonase YvrE
MYRPLNKILSLLFLLTVVTCGHANPFKDAPTLQQAWILSEGLAEPESVIFHAKQNTLFVSSINGDGKDRDNNGYISKVSPDGLMLEQKWATGLHGPKGMAIFDDTLFVSDVDALVAIDINTGKIIKRYRAPEPGFLNDVAVDKNGNVYMSDSYNARVFRLAGDKLEVWLNFHLSANTNGLYAHEDYLVIAAGDKRHNKPGKNRYLKKVLYGDKETGPLFDNIPVGSIDAVERDEYGGYYLSDWPQGLLMYQNPAGTLFQILKPGRGSADLDYRAPSENSPGGMIYLPMMLDNALIAYKVIWKE